MEYILKIRIVFQHIKMRILLNVKYVKKVLH